MVESPDKTSSTPPSFITDAKGKLWSITPDALKGMMVIGNGVVETATANVALLYYFNHELYYKNTTDNWFVRRTTWQASGDPTQMPISLESVEGTAVTTVGPAITSANGERWTLANTGAQPMQVAVNGVSDTTTGLVVKLYYSNHMVYQTNSAGGWWSKTQNSDAWTATSDPTPVAPPPVSTESPDATSVTTVGPAITSASGEKWTLANTGAQPMQVAVNGVSDTTTGLVVKLYYSNHMVYQTNSAGGWWSKSVSSDTWSQTSDPTGAVVPPVTPPPTSSIPAPAQAASAGYTRLVFEDDFLTNTTIAKAQYDTSGYNWYFAQRNGLPANPNEWVVNTTATAASIKNGNTGGGAKASSKGGILTLKTGLFPNANLISVPGWAMNIGKASLPPMGTGHWKQSYIEAYIQFVPDQNTSQIYTATGWPAFWSWAAEGIGDYGFPGSNLHTPDTIEVDFLEQFGHALWQSGTGDPLTQWSAGLINHQTGGQGGGGGGLGRGPIDKNWHSYGFLWVPGHVSMYFDDQRVGDFPLTAGAAALDKQSLFITLGTGPNWQMNIDYVRVWQK